MRASSPEECADLDAPALRFALCSFLPTFQVKIPIGLVSYASLRTFVHIDLQDSESPEGHRPLYDISVSIMASARPTHYCGLDLRLAAGNRAVLIVDAILGALVISAVALSNWVCYGCERSGGACRFDAPALRFVSFACSTLFKMQIGLVS